MPVNSSVMRYSIIPIYLNTEYFVRSFSENPSRKFNLKNHNDFEATHLFVALRQISAQISNQNKEVFETRAFVYNYSAVKMIDHNA